jgi:hypothetical protein
VKNVTAGVSIDLPEMTAVGWEFKRAFESDVLTTTHGCWP